MRKLSDNFLKFLDENKDIRNFMSKLKKDSTLDFEIRENKLQVYYRGAELFSIEEDLTNKKFSFKKSPNKYIEQQEDEVNKETIKEMLHCKIPQRKNILDQIKINGPEGSERETQQIIVRENNLNTNADQTDYYIADIEYAVSSSNLRFDLLAARTLHDGSDRSTSPKRFAIIELKYSTSVIFENGKKDSVDGNEGKSSLKGHFSDLAKFIANESNLIELKEQIKSSFNQKLKLGFIKKPKVDCDLKITDKDLYEKPEYIIILANYNVNELNKKSKLHDLLVEIKKEYKTVFEKFDVKFATSAFMGYGLYADYMISYDDFLDKIYKPKKKVLTDEEFKKQFIKLNNTWHYGEEKRVFDKQKFADRYNNEANKNYTEDGKEEWKSLSHIAGYRNYWVSSLGRVRIGNYVLEQDDFNNSGYLKLDPHRKYKGRVDHEVNVYTLIAMGFLGKELNDGYDVHHLDNNGYDCRPKNLILLTRKQHIAVHSNIEEKDLDAFLSEE